MKVSLYLFDKEIISGGFNVAGDRAHGVNVFGEIWGNIRVKYMGGIKGGKL